MGKQKWSMGPPNSPICNPTFTKMVAAEDREEKNLAKQMISQTSVTKSFGMSRTTRCIWHNHCVATYNAPARKQTNDACLRARGNMCTTVFHVQCSNVASSGRRDTSTSPQYNKKAYLALTFPLPTPPTLASRRAICLSMPNHPSAVQIALT